MPVHVAFTPRVEIHLDGTQDMELACGGPNRLVSLGNFFALPAQRGFIDAPPAILSPFE
jgi:hypothetical protein